MAKFFNHLVIAQLTDIHLYEDPEQSLLGIKTEASYQAVLAELSKLTPQPDLLLLTGDLTQDGSRSAYKRLQRSLESLQIPSYWLPGNHDNPHVMREELSGAVVSSDKQIKAKGWQILLLDSTIPGQVHGNLSKDSLAWLEQKLAAYPDLPALVSLHHPALPLGSAWLDPICLQNHEEFWAVCDRYPQVRLVVCGHAHQECDSIRSHRLQKVRYLVSPSTCIQFEPHNPKFQIDDKPPGFRLLHLYPNGHIETEVHRLSAHRFQANLAAVGY